MDAAEDARRQALEDSRGEQEYNARVDKKVRVGCHVETSVAVAVAACKRAAVSARHTQSNAKARVDKQTDKQSRLDAVCPAQQLTFMLPVVTAACPCCICSLVNSGVPQVWHCTNVLRMA